MTAAKRIGGEELPVDVVARHLVCENTKFFVYFDHVIDKAGDEVNNYLVVSPKGARENLVTGVAILPINAGKIGLIRIYRPAIRDYSWEIPHGFVDGGESEKTAALRELLEETWLTVKEESFASLGYVTPDSGVLAARVHLFTAEVNNATCVVKHELGLREFRFFSLSEFKQMIKESEIQDTFTLSAWCKYQFLESAGNLHA